MIRRTVKTFTREDKVYELIERETYWIFWFIPLYIQDTIVEPNEEDDIKCKISIENTELKERMKELINGTTRDMKRIRMYQDIIDKYGRIIPSILQYGHDELSLGGYKVEPIFNDLIKRYIILSKYLETEEPIQQSNLMMLEEQLGITFTSKEIPLPIERKQL